MKLNKLLDGFINDDLEVEDIINETGFCYTKVINLIKRYYSLNNSMPEKIKIKISSVYDRMYELNQLKMSYDDIAKIYNCTPSTIKNALINYCKYNSKILNKVEEYDEQKEELTTKEKQFAKEIYILKSSGMSYKKISSKYKLGTNKIAQLLKKYCEKNKIEMPPAPKTVCEPKKINITDEEIYNLKLQGLTYAYISYIANCSTTKIRSQLIRYCDDNNLEFPSRITTKK